MAVDQRHSDDVQMGRYFLKRDLIGPKPKFKKINTDRMRVCEVGKTINNKTCTGQAYRKVVSKHGNKWTCDNCAQAICQESLENITTRADRYVPTGRVNL